MSDQSSPTAPPAGRPADCPGSEWSGRFLLRGSAAAEGRWCGVAETWTPTMDEEIAESWEEAADNGVRNHNSALGGVETNPYLFI